MPDVLSRRRVSVPRCGFKSAQATQLQRATKATCRQPPAWMWDMFCLPREGRNFKVPVFSVRARRRRTLLRMSAFIVIDSAQGKSVDTDRRQARCSDTKRCAVKASGMENGGNKTAETGRASRMIRRNLRATINRQHHSHASNQTM